MKFKNIILFILLISIFSLLTSCDTTNPPSNKKLTLTAEDASCTEAWLNLKTENISLPTEIKIKQNDSTVVEANINSNDTTLFVENLLPNQTYTYQTTIKQLNNETIKSDNINVLTMDTTSHNFTWETFTFGGVNGSSYLKDVAIINENNIWAVGEIHTEDTDKFDSNGVWVKPYNAVHWDGSTWELKRILVDYRGEPNFAPLEGVFALPDGQIIFSSGLPYLPKGNSWQLYHLWDLGILDNDDGGVNSIWGTSIDNLYFVGSKGTIVHYNGSSWTKIESGTDLIIQDIWGASNDAGKNLDILAVASDKYQNNGMKILKIESNEATEIKTNGLPWSLSGLWFPSSRKCFVVGDGNYSTNDYTYGWQRKAPFPLLYTHAIKGEAFNSIALCGAYGMLSYYNGTKWYTTITTEGPKYSNVDIIKNTIVAVGTLHGVEACITIGRR